MKLQRKDAEVTLDGGDTYIAGGNIITIQAAMPRLQIEVSENFSVVPTIR